MELRPKHHALLFACLAQAAAAARGVDGKEAIVRGVSAYGEQRGRRMAKRARQDGVKIDAKSYLLYGEWWDEHKESDFSCIAFRPEVRLGCKVCPWVEAWREAGLAQCGRLYCSVVDAALARGFGLELELLASQALGQQDCCFRFPNQAIDEAQQAELKEQARRLGLRAKMGWDYHNAHLYACLRQSLINALGREGGEIARAGLEDFGRRCGQEAREAVERLADTDFEALPPYEGMARE